MRQAVSYPFYQGGPGGPADRFPGFDGFLPVYLGALAGIGDFYAFCNLLAICAFYGKIV